ELMKRINDRRVGVCLDIGHANYSRASIDEWVNALGENIRYAHLSDNEGLFDNHMSLGTGTVDVLRASELLSPLGDIPMTLEVGGMENIKKSIDFIKENHLFGR
ncbi:MAG: sugar phosphate isomerase/epimerase, partial [Clostridia bacterium]|nr:sugar phosphate isomerase/epimerase [Clostridia bacterium]